MNHWHFATSKANYNYFLAHSLFNNLTRQQGRMVFSIHWQFMPHHQFESTLGGFGISRGEMNCEIQNMVNVITRRSNFLYNLSPAQVFSASGVLSTITSIIGRTSLSWPF